MIAPPPFFSSIDKRCRIWRCANRGSLPGGTSWATAAGADPSHRSVALSGAVEADIVRIPADAGGQVTGLEGVIRAVLEVSWV